MLAIRGHLKTKESNLRIHRVLEQSRVVGWIGWGHARHLSLVWAGHDGESVPSTFTTSHDAKGDEGWEMQKYIGRFACKGARPALPDRMRVFFPWCSVARQGTYLDSQPAQKDRLTGSGEGHHHLQARLVPALHETIEPCLPTGAHA